MRRPTRRLTQLYVGLVLYGTSDSMLVLSRLGLDPWDVFHQGLSRRTGIAIGTWTIIVGIIVLLLWIPLRQRPGVGTLSNVVVIGLVINFLLAHFSAPHAPWEQWLLMFFGVALNGLATALYIGACLGPGPRDGLMTGLARISIGGKTRPIGLIRACIELCVLITGWLLGGTVGVGTVVYAAGIGPLVHWLLPILKVPELSNRG